MNLTCIHIKCISSCKSDTQGKTQVYGLYLIICIFKSWAFTVSCIYYMYMSYYFEKSLPQVSHLYQWMEF